MTDLRELSERCEKAPGATYELDCAIWDAIYPGERDARFAKLNDEGPYKGRLGPADRDGYIKPLRAFTASLDAAMSLVPEGCGFTLAHTLTDAAVGRVFGQSVDVGGCAKTPALALCAAALKARASIQKGDGDEE